VRPAAFLFLLLQTAAAQAQTPALRIEAGGRSATVEAVLLGTAPGSGYPASSLAHLGGELIATEFGVRVVVFGDTLTFWTASPYFLARNAVQPLARPVGAQGNDVVLPSQFFSDWLPAAYAARVSFSNGVLRVSGPVVFVPPKPERLQRIVVIDPGHGGEDTGKIGPNRLREKDVALQLSQKLSKILADSGYEVHLTRTRDTLVALDERARMANRWKNGRPAAVFLSVHMNSTERGARTATGFETFFLSQARTEDERRVAEMENAAVLFEDGPSKEVSEEDLILNGLRNDFYVRASSDLADVIQSGIAEVHTAPNRGVKRAGFLVLVGALMPAVLIEAGFISHPTESRQIGDAVWQQRIAEAIARSVQRFFDSHEHLWTGGS
jgi:N-acetylmuramoyl-L-alanine amidase